MVACEWYEEVGGDFVVKTKRVPSTVGHGVDVLVWSHDLKARPVVLVAHLPVVILGEREIGTAFHLEGFTLMKAVDKHQISFGVADDTVVSVTLVGGKDHQSVNWGKEHECLRLG
ncbi:hypothetical protein A3I99_02790 [Candidatus Kaiserbacteria bacterium RIFCSPLOWO2_02_FULL_45_11b]|uniref:Uncharacterized protein n=1 Tax=Candidatus Kaiserbacteria bacterium RIFCSPLOWO2_12_FULL_45_26 TaxID=1798525 RepID=A0A1F6FFF0_9BACT|nr:MAG: hypothetical protein A2929_04535 [Candidatus Kaiserbacteria bacterium RIFCSPLOWO2_01_FULL_45_25]OGG81974.1 MAG: hypothetical protein A3I99_02790 [Candidatus Kaiserbacteria bacterium RIFCSPLOWO2_02_FULL_45_11b]OGG84570.1 MAG: hypothetical protein A3G90_00580 [Candidatus Kaiserbacteria bacterium RIFCSPLOWO2_12_FULL_45_26]